MTPDHVHGDDPRESLRLQDQAGVTIAVIEDDGTFCYTFIKGTGIRG